VANDYGTFVKSQALVDYLRTIMPEKISTYYPLVYKLGHVLNNENEVNAMLTLLADIYQLGFYKSVQAHKDALDKLGLVAEINFQQTQDGLH
jgi:hypothetical protein